MKTDILYEGDCLEIMGGMQSNSIDLIIADPPYFEVKDTWWDNQWTSEKEYLGWLRLVANEWVRLLRPTGSFYCFSSPKMSGRIQVMLSEYFNILNEITWVKKAPPGFEGWKKKCSKKSLRNWYPSSERVIFGEHLLENSLPGAIREARIKAGLTIKELCGAIGAYGKVNNGGSVSNWEAGRSTPSNEYVEKIEAEVKCNLPKPRTFNAPTTFYEDVWEFELVRPYEGKHPCEKPEKLLKHIINSSSVTGDVVFDCFSGSGSTLWNARSLDRRYIGIEIQSKWVKKFEKKLQD